MNTKAELFKNAFYATAFQLAPRFANVVLFILLGRLSGSSVAGVFALATTYLLISTTIMRGLDDLVVRQVSKEPERAFTYLVNFSLIRIALSVVLYGILVIIVYLGFNYSEVTTRAILILGLSLLPDSLAFVAQSVLLGLRRFQGSAITVSAVSLVKLIGGVTIVLGGGSIEQIAWLWVLASIVGMIIHWLLVLANIERRKLLGFVDTAFLKSSLRIAALFFVITALATLETQMDTIILSGYRGEEEVAWFGAATTVAFSLILLSQAYRFSVYPYMSRYVQETGEKLTQLYDNSIQLLAALIFPMVFGIIIIAPQIVPFIFGDDYFATIQVLQILILALIFIFLNEPNIRMMLVHDRQKWIAVILIAAVTTNILLNLVLARYWGAVGSAAARVSSAVLFFTLTSIYVGKYLTQPNLPSLIYKPLIASAVMTLILIPIREWFWPLLIVIGAVLYLIVLRLIGGFPPIRWRDLFSQMAGPSKDNVQTEAINNTQRFP